MSAAPTSRTLATRAFDLLALDWADPRERPLSDRREALAGLLAGGPGDILLVEQVTGDGREVLRQACRLGLEGVVAKRRDRPYRSGEATDWIKAKCTTVESFAVVGFDPEGRHRVASLKLARLESGELVRCGWVGSGLGETDARELRAALEAGEPVVVDVEHRGFTPAGELRHPVFKEYHRDWPADSVRPPLGPGAWQARGRLASASRPSHALLGCPAH